MSSYTRLRRTHVKMIGFGEDAPEHPRVHEGHDAQRQFVVEPRISSFFVVINSPIVPAGRKINWRFLYFWTTEAIRWLTQHRRRLWARSRADFFSVPRIWRRRELTSRALASGKMSTPKSPIRDGERAKSVKTTPPCWFQAAKTIINEPETDRPKKLQESKTSAEMFRSRSTKSRLIRLGDEVKIIWQKRVSSYNN